MEMKKISKGVIAVAVAASLSAPAAFAAEAAPDFSGILTGLSVTAITGAIVAAGGLKAVANFTKWGANKLAGFFR